MEIRAFDLVREGDKKTASQILFGQEYKEQKQIYAEGINSFITGLQTNIDLKLKQNNERVFKFGLLSVVFLFLTWSCALILIRSYFTKRRLMEAKEKAEVASEAKSIFLDNVSHELKTPLHIILGFTDLMSKHPENYSQEKLKESVKHIQNAGQGLLELINQVLNFQKIEAGNFQPDIVPLEVASLIRDSMNLLKPLANKHDVRLVDEIKEEAFALGDNDSLKQVLFNLISNAIKYNKKGGIVRICITKMPNYKIRINVVDTGPGINEEKQTSLCEPFNRLGMEALTIPGTGIGLSIAKQLTELMGGHSWVY